MHISQFVISIVLYKGKNKLFRLISVLVTTLRIVVGFNVYPTADKETGDVILIQYCDMFHFQNPHIPNV